MIGPFAQLDSRMKTVPPLILGLIKTLGINEVVKLIIDGSLPVLKVACHSQGIFHILRYLYVRNFLSFHSHVIDFLPGRTLEGVYGVS